MQQQSHEALAEIRDVLLETYAVNDAMNQLPSRISTRQLGARSCPKPRAAAAAPLPRASSQQSPRLDQEFKNSAPHLKGPAPVDPDRVTMKQAASVHKKSAAQCLRMLTDAFSPQPKRQVTKFSRGSWTPIWPAGSAHVGVHVFA